MNLHYPELHTLAQTLPFHAGRAPEAPAIRTSDGGDVSYSELHTRALALAASLHEAGISPGDRVAYIARESSAYWELLFAVAQLGAVIVPINPKLAQPEIHHILSHSESRLVFIDPDHSIAGTTGISEVLLDNTYAPSRDTPRQSPPAAAVTPETPIAQLYTSGTTGLPKGVVLPHRSFFAIANSLAKHRLDWIDWHAGDVALIAIPGFHIGGIWYAAQAFNAGATVFSMPVVEAGLAHDAIRAHGVNVGVFVPALLRSLLDEHRSRRGSIKLRKVVYGGAPISDALLGECSRELGASMAQIYGLTETGCTALCLTPSDHVAGSPRLRAAGRPYPGVEVRISIEGEVQPVGAIGEVLLQTPAIMLEYWKNPEATASAIVDGWFHTGDAGYLDDDGYLFIQDRYKDMILVGGENVYPAEVENAVARHAAVADCAVIGVPDETAGEAVMAFVQPHAGTQVSTRQMALHLRPLLADFKRPTRWEIVEQIPRNASGKILRRTLRERFWQGRASQVL